jgi:DNA-binding CsgD family transcriptional regulator
VQLAGAEYAGGDVDSACARLDALDREPTRRLLDRHAAHGWELLIRSRLALGHPDAARDIAKRASRRAEAAGLSQGIATVRCGEAAVLLAGGEPDRASELLADAWRLADRVGNKLLSARAHALAGIASEALGEHERGIAELKGAERTLFMCGALREAAAAARELRRLGQRAPHRPRSTRQSSGLAALSRRENDIAAEVASGKTNREIAAALFLSEKTVGNHLSRIFEKLGVHSRAALATIIARDTAARAAGSAEDSPPTRIAES